MSMQFQWVDKTNYNSSFCGEGNETDTVIRCDIDFVSVFAVPGFLLLATYIYGIYLFWGYTGVFRKSCWTGTHIHMSFSCYLVWLFICIVKCAVCLCMCVFSCV